MKNLTKKLTATLLIAFMLMTAAACNNATAPSEQRDEVRLDTQPAVVDYESRSAVAGAEGFYMEDVNMATEIAYEPADAAASGTGTSTQTAVDESALLTERMLIRYVTVSCETLEFTSMTSNIESQVAALGGYIESKSYFGTGNSGDLRHASYTIRVSSEALDQLVNQIGTSAIITNTTESTEDVTLSYTDMQARVESLRIEQDTLNELLAQADSLETILILQDELTNIRYQIESYESQMRVLENLSSYSTLTLNIDEVLEETPVEEAHVKTYNEKISEAFHDGMKRVKEGFEDFGLYVAENAVAIGIKIILLVVAIVVIRIVIKKIKKSKAKKAALKTSAAPVTAAPVKTENKAEEKKD